MQKNGIEWTQKTWNPLRGCSKVSEGCRNCYAMSVAHRFSGEGMPYEGLTRMVAQKPEWTGKIMLLDDKVREPFHWKKPSMVFVNSMSDLFHEDVPFEFIYKVFETMYLSYWHTFQVLTKRPERMAKVVPDIIFHLERNYQVDIDLKNIWLGTSVENQATADERIPFLLMTPATTRFLSCEPLLGPVDLDGYLKQWPPMQYPGSDYGHTNRVDWVIVGGESGKNARPMNPEWARNLRSQCREAEVKYFFKQWGETLPYGQEESYESEWVNKDYPTNVIGYICGKKASGKLLDGCEWLEMPEVIHA